MQGALVFAFLINSIISYYLYKLRKEKCECAFGWKHSYLTVYVAWNLFVAILLMVLNKNNMAQLMGKHVGPVALYGVVSFILLLAYIVIAYQYVQELETKPCPCSLHPIRTAFKWFIYLQIALMVLVTAIMFMGMMAAMNGLAKSKGK